MNWKFLSASVLCCSAMSVWMVTEQGLAQSKPKSAEQSVVLIEEDESEFVYYGSEQTMRLLCGDENSYIKIGDTDEDGNPAMVKYFAHPAQAFRIKDSSGEYILTVCGAGEGDGEDGYGVGVVSMVKRTPDGWRRVYSTKNYHSSYHGEGLGAIGGESLQHVEAVDIDGDSKVEIVHSVYREKKSNYRIYIKRKDGSRIIGEVNIENDFFKVGGEDIRKSCAYELKDINLYFVNKSGKTTFSQKASHSKSKKAIGEKTYDYIVGHFTNEQDCVLQ